MNHDRTRITGWFVHRPALKAALDDVAGQVEGAVVVASEEGSIKTAERMVEAMKSEIAKKHQAEEGAGWQPVSACVEINQCVGCTVLASSSGEEPASPRHRAGAASMAWLSTRRFSTNAP